MAEPAQKLDFQHLMEELRDEDGVHISPERFARALKIGKQDLARLAKVHRNTVQRFPHSSQLQQFLRDSLRVLKAATVFAGGDYLRAIYWFRNDAIQPLKHKTAEELVSEGQTDKVLHYLDTLHAGTG